MVHEAAVATSMQVLIFSSLLTLVLIVFALSGWLTILSTHKAYNQYQYLLKKYRYQY